MIIVCGLAKWIKNVPEIQLSAISGMWHLEGEDNVVRGQCWIINLVERVDALAFSFSSRIVPFLAENYNWSS